MLSIMNCCRLRCPRVFMWYGQVTMPMLVVPLVRGMNQNQPWANQKMVMLPSSAPSRRCAPSKCAYTAELLWRGLRCLILKRLARKVSRPEASITKRARHCIS
ncbi:hypothetical protein D9M68_933270 [compost metagenome]